MKLISLSKGKGEPILFVNPDHIVSIEAGLGEAGCILYLTSMPHGILILESMSEVLFKLGILELEAGQRIVPFSQMTPEQQVAIRSMGKAISGVEEETLVRGALDFPEVPTKFLIPVAQRAVPEGHRNTWLMSRGVELRANYPEDWVQGVKFYNYQLDNPLPMPEVETMIGVLRSHLNK